MKENDRLGIIPCLVLAGLNYLLAAEAVDAIRLHDVSPGQDQGNLHLPGLERSRNIRRLG